MEFEDEKSNAAADKDGIAQRLEEIYKRLEFIDAYSAEARAASILAVSSRHLPLCLYAFLKEFFINWIISPRWFSAYISSCAPSVINSRKRFSVAMWLRLHFC